MSPFHKLITTQGQCEIWTGALNTKGQPMARYTTQLVNPARVLVGRLHGIPLEILMPIRRSCETYLCVNPHHHHII